MQEEISEVKSCLDEIVKKPDVSNQDLARAMQSFVTRCYVKHITITGQNAEKIGNIEKSVDSIAEWIKPKIEKERQWTSDKRRIVVHLIMWGTPIMLLWILGTFGAGFRIWVRNFLIG